MIAAEQKARLTYDNILRLADDPDVRDVIKFLRAREIVHYQRFGEALPSIWNGPGRAAGNLFKALIPQMEYRCSLRTAVFFVADSLINI